MDASQPAHPVRESRDTLWRELRGVVERITYQHPETGFTVARLLLERTGDGAGRDDDRLVTVVGTLPNLQPGEAISATGWWKQDPRHGWQFQARQDPLPVPVIRVGRRYLVSRKAYEALMAAQHEPATQPA